MRLILMMPVRTDTLVNSTALKISIFSENNFCMLLSRLVSTVLTTYTSTTEQRSTSGRLASANMGSVVTQTGKKYRVAERLHINHTNVINISPTLWYWKHQKCRVILRRY